MQFELNIFSLVFNILQPNFDLHRLTLILIIDFKSKNYYCNLNYKANFKHYNYLSL